MLPIHIKKITGIFPWLAGKDEKTHSMINYLFAILIVIVCTAINFVIYPHVEISNIVMVFLLGVILIALLGQHGPSILISFLSVVAFDYFFIPPRFSLAVDNKQYMITFAMMLLVSQVISYLMILVKKA